MACPAKPPWDVIPLVDLLELLKLVFKVITVAMRFEPANARFFDAEVPINAVDVDHFLVATSGCYEDKQRRWLVILLVVQYITYVATEIICFKVRYSSLIESLRLLGCFGERKAIYSATATANSDELSKKLKSYQRMFNRIFMDREDGNVDLLLPVVDVPTCLVCVCYIIRLLYDMALDNFEKY